MGLLFALFACAEGPFDAPYDATVGSTTSGLTVVYTAGVVAEDGVGLVYHNRAIVKREDEYGRSLPLENIAVDVYSYWTGTYLLPAAAISEVDEFRTDCEAGEGDEKYQELCAALLEDPDQQYYELTATYDAAVEDTAGEGPSSYRPNYFRGTTDNQGVVDFYLFVDSTPGPSTDFSIEMSISSDTESLVVSTATAEGK